MEVSGLLKNGSTDTSFFFEVEAKQRSHQCRGVLNRYPQITYGEPTDMKRHVFCLLYRYVHYKRSLQLQNKRVVAVFHDRSKQVGETERDLFTCNVEIEHLCRAWKSGEISICLPLKIPVITFRRLVETSYAETLGKLRENIQNKEV